MKIGFFAIGIGHLARPDLITTVATNAERLNFATVWAPEHIVFLERFESQYPYSRGEGLPLSTLEIPLLNPFLALTYAAARTTRIRLATGICLVPEYNPLLLAKLCRPLVEVSLEDLQKEFEARYGPKVQCRLIAFQAGDNHKQQVWEKVKDNEKEFVIEAGFVQVFYVLSHEYLLIKKRKKCRCPCWERTAARGKEKLESEKESDGGLCQVGNFVEM